MTGVMGVGAARRAAIDFSLGVVTSALYATSAMPPSRAGEGSSACLDSCGVDVGELRGVCLG